MPTRELGIADYLKNRGKRVLRRTIDLVLDSAYVVALHFIIEGVLVVTIRQPDRRWVDTVVSIVLGIGIVFYASLAVFSDMAHQLDDSTSGNLLSRSFRFMKNRNKND